MREATRRTEGTQARGSRALGRTVRVPGAVRAHVPSAGRLCSVRAAARLKTTSLDFGFHQEELTDRICPPAGQMKTGIGSAWVSDSGGQAAWSPVPENTADPRRTGRAPRGADHLASEPSEGDTGISMASVSPHRDLMKTVSPCVQKFP